MDKSMESAIAEYKKSMDFEDDCNTIRSSAVLKLGYLPDDAVIEDMAISEKKKELLIEWECEEKGHNLAEGDEEIFNGVKWTYCLRCGQWFERRDGK